MRNPEHTLAKAIALLEKHMKRVDRGAYGVQFNYYCVYCNSYSYRDDKDINHKTSCPLMEIKREADE